MCTTINNSFFHMLIYTHTNCVALGALLFFILFLFADTFYGSFVFTTRRCIFHANFLVCYTIFMLDISQNKVKKRKQKCCFSLHLAFVEEEEVDENVLNRVQCNIEHVNYVRCAIYTPTNIKTMRTNSTIVFLSLQITFFLLSSWSNKSVTHTIQHELHIIFTVKAVLYVFTLFLCLPFLSALYRYTCIYQYAMTVNAYVAYVCMHKLKVKREWKTKKKVSGK